MNTVAILTGIWQSFVYAGAGILFILLAKIIADKRTKNFDDDIHIDDGNIAVGLRRAGLYLGIAIGLSGSMSGFSKGFFIDFTYLLIDGVIIVLLMFLTRSINDFIMLKDIDNDEECIKVFEKNNKEKTIGNNAVGITEAGMYIATGFILHGSFSGTDGTLIQSISSSIVFFVLGQLFLLLFGFMYEIITPFNVKDEIKDNNLAAGIGLSGILIALGIILKSSIAGPFIGWANDLISFCSYAIWGIIMLLIFRAIVDRLLLPSTNIAIEVKEDRNIAALIVVQSAVNAFAIIIAYSI